MSHSIPVSVMMPLNLISNDGNLNDPTSLNANLGQLKAGGVDGVMTDVWWGIVEQEGPQQYNWSAYLQFAELVKQNGLSLQVVMSFHQCGTNVGDACYITLPNWVLNVGNSYSIFYKDQQGGTDEEYISLGADNQTIFQGRSPIQIYSDFMQSFATNFNSYLGSTINQVQVGLGPAGEMRYPSYQLQDNKWTYCGIGEFQCYDDFMLANLKSAAYAINQPSWGNGGPDNAGTYDSNPSGTGFFTDNTNDNYQSSYGQFFLGWYTNQLLSHGDAILSEAYSIFNPLNVNIAAKISGIHWWYAADNHAAEVTAGYFNTDNNNAYLQIANMLAKYDATFDFTCLEMVDSDPGCDSAPQELVKQTILASQQAGVSYAGENALPVCDPTCDQSKFNEIITESTQYGDISRFTYLRMDSNLLSQSNWQMFTNFVSQMQ